MNDTQVVNGMFSIISAAFMVPRRDLVSKCKLRRLAEARFCAYGFLAFTLDWGITRTGRACPYKVHPASIFYGVQRYQDLDATDRKYHYMCEAAFVRILWFLSITQPDLNQIELEVNG